MNQLIWMLYSAGFLVLAIAILFAAKRAFDWITPYKLDDQLTERDNPAVGIILAGFLLGVMAVICAAFTGDGALVPSIQSFASEAGAVTVYALIGIVFLFVAGIINDKLVLHRFCNRKEIIERKNTAVATVIAATYIGSGLIIAGGLKGCLSLMSAIYAFALGQILLCGFAHLYHRLTRYDDQKEIGENRNLAAGLATGGNLLAFSLIIMKALCFAEDHVELWTRFDRLMYLLYYAVAGTILLILTRVINDKLFLPKADVNTEISVDKNTSAGLIEASLAIAMGAALVFCL